jgi:phage-related tail protein
MADKLQLEVLLAAIDRASGPLKNVMKSSKDMAKAVKEARDKLKELDAVSSSITSFKKLSKDLAITSNQLKAAQERVKTLSQAMAQADKPTSPPRPCPRNWKKPKKKPKRYKTSKKAWPKA